jgi:hypothetical protein
LAAARMEVRALRVVIIPALAMLTVCCSCNLSAHDPDAQASFGPSCNAEQDTTHHDFVQNRTGRVGHLVKLVDAADTAI